MSAPPSPEAEKGPAVSELELESAILKGVASHRPVGQHKHVLIIALQADVHRQTGLWVPVGTLWDTLGELYDLEALDGMSSSTPSLPASPASLSPIPEPKRRRPRGRAAGSDSPLSTNSSPPPSAPPGSSRSAAIIDSAHFGATFELPLHTGTSTPDGRDTDSEAAGGGGEDMDFGRLVYARAKGGEEDEEAWDEGVRAQIAATDTSGPASGTANATRGPGRRTRKSRGSTSATASAPASTAASRRASAAAADRGERDSSPLSSDAERRARNAANAATYTTADDTDPEGDDGPDTPTAADKPAAPAPLRRGGRPRKRPRGFDSDDDSTSRDRDKPAPRRGRRR